MAPRRRQTSPLQAAKLNGDPADGSARLEVLIEDYSQGREDQRTWNVVLATLFAVALSLVGLLAAAVTQTCKFSASKSCTYVPDYLIGAAPLLPFTLLAYAQMLGTLATFRSFYLRAIEKEIREYAGLPLQDISGVKSASYIEIETEAVSLRRGRFSYRAINFIIVVTIVTVFGGFSAYIGEHMDPITQIIMVIIYVPIVLLLVIENYTAGPGGRSMFNEMVRRYQEHQNSASHGQTTKKNERSLLPYLLMPRADEWVKWLIAPGAFIVTAWAIGAFHNWAQFVLIWLVLEYLIYEARYQWNDIRGFHEDTDHPESAARRRLPGGEHARRNILASSFVAVLRLVLALCIGAIAHLLGSVTLLIGLVFGAAIAYEALRAAPVGTSLSFRPTLRSAAIWITVGLGYAIRAGTGIWFGGFHLPSLAATNGVLYFFAFGIMFVLLTWVLEAASYCTTDGRDSLFPTPGLTVKPHIAILLRWTGWKVVGGAGSLPGAAQPVLKDRRGKPYAPWNIALLLGTGLGAVVGADFVRSSPAPAAYGSVVIISLLGAILIMIFTSFPMRLAVTAAVTASLVGITLPAVHNPRAIIAAIPWIVIAVAYAFFRSSSYEDVVKFGQNLFQPLRAAAYAFGPLMLRLVVGRQTWQSIDFRSRTKTHG